MRDRYIGFYLLPNDRAWREYKFHKTTLSSASIIWTTLGGEKAQKEWNLMNVVTYVAKKHAARATAWSLHFSEMVEEWNIFRLDISIRLQYYYGRKKVRRGKKWMILEMLCLFRFLVEWRALNVAVLFAVSFWNVLERIERKDSFPTEPSSINLTSRRGKNGSEEKDVGAIAYCRCYIIPPLLQIGWYYEEMVVVVGWWHMMLTIVMTI
jgi:hypothetical protein